MVIFEDNVADFGPAFRLLSDTTNQVVSVQVSNRSEFRGENHGILW